MLLTDLTYLKLGCDLLKRQVAGSALILLTISVLVLSSNTQPAKASGTIYIRTDGSIDPPTAPISSVDNVTYTFGDNISDSVVVERDSIVIDGDGYTLQGNGSGTGMLVSNRFNVTIKNVVVRGFSDEESIGIHLYHSPNCTVTDNFVSNNYYGIQSHSDYDVIANNTASSNSWGILLYATYNHVVGNNVSYNSEGIHVYNSNHTVSSNVICGNTKGIHLEACSSDIISHNRIFDNSWGIWLSGARGDRIFHNEFTNNNEQVHDESIPQNPNTWDNGYPSGGNYWSDYAGVDEFSGPNQDQLGIDGIGDTPYTIDTENRDQYPLMVPWGTEYTSFDWPMFHHDACHTGYSPSKSPESNNTIWNYTLGGFIYSSPTVAEGRVYLGSFDCKIYCLDAVSGASIWNYTTDNVVGSSAAVFEGKVYVGSTDGNVYCLNASDGAFIWKYAMGIGLDGVTSSPTVVEGRVYVGSDDKSVYCLNASTGAYIWSYATGADIFFSSPAVADGKVFIGSCDRRVYCLNASTGAHIWNYTTGGSVYSSPAIVDGKVYVGSEDRNVYCLDVSSGSQVWNFTTGAMVETSSPAVVSGRLYIGSDDGKIYCLDALSGVQIWNYTTERSVRSSPAVADGKLYVGSDDGNAYCLNASSGERIWSYALGSESGVSSPAVANGRVYAASNDHKVFAFESAIHDIAATNITTCKSGCTPMQTVCQGYTCHINATVENQAAFTETFNVTVYATDQTASFVVGKAEATLGPNDNATLTFVWNTTGFAKDNYTISAIADPVSGETDLADNNLTYGWILVTIAGDINGDRKVDVKDVYAVARAYGTSATGPNPPGRTYNPNCDINDDHKIDAKDYYIVCKHYGEIDP